MKIICLVLFLLVVAVTQVNGSEITTTVEERDGNTYVVCTANGGGDVSKAYITVYGDGSKEPLVLRGEMDLSVENRATYMLSGLYRHISGKCKMFLAEKGGILGIASDHEESERKNYLNGEFSSKK